MRKESDRIRPSTDDAQWTPEVGANPRYVQPHGTLPGRHPNQSRPPRGRYRYLRHTIRAHGRRGRMGYAVGAWGKSAGGEAPLTTKSLSAIIVYHDCHSNCFPAVRLNPQPVLIGRQATIIPRKTRIRLGDTPTSRSFAGDPPPLDTKSHRMSDMFLLNTVTDRRFL